MKTLVSPSPLSHEPTSEQLLILTTTAFRGFWWETATLTECTRHYTIAKIPEKLLNVFSVKGFLKNSQYNWPVKGLYLEYVFRYLACSAIG